MKFKPPQWAYDAAVMAIAIVHLGLVIKMDNQPAAGLAIVGVAALAFRRRFPLLVFALTLPAAVMVTEKVASMFAIYALTQRARKPWVPIAAVVVLTGCFIYSDVNVWVGFLTNYGVDAPDYVLGLKLHQVSALREMFNHFMFAAVPAVVSYLLKTRNVLADQLREITEAREHEQLLLTEQALASERAQLAREMHDVVSHQVSLIAVQAGALQVKTKDREAKEAASTIRKLSVTTLEELRHMVRVLRASGIKATELTPQPKISQLEELVGGSGIEARLETGAMPDLDPPIQRAIYRTVQEALTNIRKHAPGAEASVRVGVVGDGVEVEVINSASERPVVDLPSSQYGLMGLRQRAELLGGTLDYGPTFEHGWRLRLRLPLGVTSGAR